MFLSKSDTADPNFLTIKVVVKITACWVSLQLLEAQAPFKAHNRNAVTPLTS